MSIQSKKELFAKSFQSLLEAKSFSKILHQGAVLQHAGRLMKEDTGIAYLYQFADRFDEAGLFIDSSWENPLKLQPRLVTETLKSDSPNMVMEILSELRMLAIAKSKYKSSLITSNEAARFLNKVMAKNIELLFPNEADVSQEDGGAKYQPARALLQFLDDHFTLTTIFDSLLEEIERLTVQRPIMVNRIIDLILAAKKRGLAKIDSKGMEKLRKYDAALTGPTQLSKQVTTNSEYVSLIKNKEATYLRNEAKQFGDSIKQTGIVCPLHAGLLQHLNNYHPELIGTALSLTSSGQKNLMKQMKLIQTIIQTAIYPTTSQSIYGLARFLERDVLSNPSVATGIHTLLDLDLHPNVDKLLTQQGVTTNGVMVAGTISVLGQPLGIGQGINPTCQSARGISLWSQHDPIYLLKLIAMAARDDNITFSLDGVPIHSRYLSVGLASDLNMALDPVSLILVPHLDRIYGEMMKRVVLKGEDGHKWVNPAFYGKIVVQGFCAVTDSYTGLVADYPGFVRLFYATHHPDYNGGRKLVYPNPVGIFMTNIYGNLSGLHAITIQRIIRDPHGHYRIYFYNPNNDSDQDWGQNIRCSIHGNGEKEGETSLPFHQFVSRIYAFHYNPEHARHTRSVPTQTVNKIETLSKESWGDNYQWSV